MPYECRIAPEFNVDSRDQTLTDTFNEMERHVTSQVKESLRLSVSDNKGH